MEKWCLSNTKQLECRIVLTYHKDGKVSVGMCDPKTGRIEKLGTHGPSRREVDRIVEDLKTSIVRAGHYLTFCERSE